MSYDIFYDKQFVKVNDKTFIPMTLAGSSNLWDCSNNGRDKRSRSWFNFSYLLDGKIAGSMEDMLERQAKTRADILERKEEEYSDKSFGYYTSLSDGGGGCNMTYGRYLGITKTGCKKALTIEQLEEEGVTLRIYTYPDKETDKKLDKLKLERLGFIPKTNKELEDFINNEASKYKSIHLHAEFMGMYESKPKWIRKKYFPKVKSERQEVKSKIGYAIKITEVGKGTYGYLSSFRGGSFRYSRNDRTGGKQFLNNKEAERYAKKIEDRRLTFKFNVIEVEYAYEKTFYVPAGKKVVLPKKKKEKKLTKKTLLAKLDLRDEGEERANFFSPENKCFLDPLGVALHDFIKGSELLERYDDLRIGLDIFRQKYPEEYYVLLD